MNKSLVWMAAFWAVLLITLTIDTIFRPHSEIYLFASGMILTFLTVFWLVADAYEMSVTPSLGLILGVVFIPYLAIPYYIIEYKGWRRSGVSFAQFSVLLGVVWAYSKILPEFI